MFISYVYIWGVCEASAAVQRISALVLEWLYLEIRSLNFISSSPIRNLGTISDMWRILQKIHRCPQRGSRHGPGQVLIGAPTKGLWEEIVVGLLEISLNQNWLCYQKMFLIATYLAFGIKRVGFWAVFVQEIFPPTEHCWEKKRVFSLDLVGCVQNFPGECMIPGGQQDKTPRTKLKPLHVLVDSSLSAFAKQKTNIPFGNLLGAIREPFSA